MTSMITCDHCGCRITQHWQVFLHVACKSAAELSTQIAAVRSETWLLTKQRRQLERYLSKGARMNPFARKRLAEKINTALGPGTIRHEISIDIHEA
jgi:hypothetical protein